MFYISRWFHPSLSDRAAKEKGILNLLLRVVLLKLNLNFIKSKLDLYKFKFNFCKFKLDFIKLNFSFKKEYGFLAHVEQKVDDGEVGQEAVLLLKNLIIGLGNEVGGGGDAGVLLSSSEVGLEVQQFAALGNEDFVKVHEERPVAFVEGAEIVLKIFEEGGVEVGSLQGVPMLVLPVAVGADAYILHLALSGDEVGFVDGDGKIQQAIGRIDGASVANGLLVVVFVLLNENGFAVQ